MGYYVIAIGGTGNKILESIVYAACADAFYTLDELGARRIIPRLDLLSVDVDAACGNTTRAKRASEYYEDVRRVLSAAKDGHRLFHTELRVDKWNMNLSRRAASVEKLAQNHRRDRLLSRAIFTKAEANLEYSEGFRGHPDLGVLFFADLLEALAESERLQEPDEFLDFLGRMRADIERGERVRVMLCGSIFGGTGASGIPALARYLRERFREDGELFELGGLTMLPYYRVPPAPHSEELEIVVKSGEFLDKARTALAYYGMAGLIRDGERDERGVFDALYLLGLPPESFVTARNYSTGSQSQQNDAHMLEWLAARCVASFLRTGFRGADAHRIDCYYYQWHTPDFRWQSFDDEADLYRMGYGTLLKSAAAFFAECYTTIRAQAEGARGRAGRVGYCAPYFGRVGRMSAASRARLQGALDSLYHFMAFFANWFTQVTRTLPPTMRERRASESARLAAAGEYARLVERAALLMDGDEGTARQRELRDEYERMLQKRDARVRELGGAAWLELLSDARERAGETLSRQENELEALRDRVALWHGADSHLIDAKTLRQEEDRLRVLERALRATEARARVIGDDIESALRENIAERFAAPREDDVETLPRNSLVDAELLSCLHELLREYGADERGRDLSRVLSAREKLQRGLQNLLVSGVPDRRGMARVVAGLGGGACDRRDPDAALAAFLATLFEAVMEEVGE